MREDSYPATPREEVVPRILQKTTFRRVSEAVPVGRAVGRTVAVPVKARQTLPAAPSARLDGIACTYAHVVEKEGGFVREGEDFAFCNTGTMVPDRYDTVVRIEDVEECGGGWYRLRALPGCAGDLVNPPGCLVAEGDVLLGEHLEVEPRDVGRFVTAGVSEVEVLRAPIVGFVPTGDELVPAGTVPPRGKVVESNSAMIAAYVEQWGGRVRTWPIQRDDPSSIEKALGEAVESCDIVVVNAGSSKGGHDYTLEVLERMGEVLTFKVDHGPGYHTTAVVAPNGVPIVGLVGPSGGAAVTAEFYLRPLIDAFLYRETPRDVLVRAALAEPVRSRCTIDFYQAVRLVARGGSLVAVPCVGTDAHARRDGLAKIPRGVGENGMMQIGDHVDVLVDKPGRWAAWLQA